MSAIRFLEMTLVVRDKEQRLMMSLRAGQSPYKIKNPRGLHSGF